MSKIGRHKQRGFTLVEAVASVILLGILLSGVYSVLSSCGSSVSRNLIRERAVEVARRHIEMLLVSKQEPESTGLEVVDEIDEDFLWKLDLERQTVGQKPATLENTVIHATVTVSLNGESSDMEPVELHRFFATLEPKPGNVVAVPLETAYEQDESYQELKKKLGREPTIQEMIDYMSKFEE